MQYVKKLMKTAEIRHLDDIKGNFGLVDSNWYYASAQSDEITGITRQIQDKYNERRNITINGILA